MPHVFIGGDALLCMRLRQVVPLARLRQPDDRRVDMSACLSVCHTAKARYLTQLVERFGFSLAV